MEETNPELLHMNSAVFEEGTMPRAVLSSKPGPALQHRSQLPQVNIIEPTTGSATVTEEDSLAQSALSASGRIKRHLHDFIR